MPPEQFSLHAAQLEEAWLNHVSFSENPAFEFGEHRFEYRMERSSRVDFEAPASAVYRLALDFEWTVDGEEVVEGVDTPFDLQIEVAGRFEWQQEEIDREYASDWLEFNGVYLLWPYLRAYVATITSLSSLPPLTLYTIQVPRPRTSAESEADEQPDMDAESQEQTPHG